MRAASAARRHVAVVFFVHGLLFASWTAHIPHIEAALGLDDAGLGLALLGAPVGSVLALCAIAPVIARLGSRRALALALGGYALAGILVGLARTPVALAAALGVWGACQGALDVSMNTQGIAVERALGRPIMAGLHAGWSLGAFAGAGAGAAAVALGVGLTAQLLVLGPLAGAVALLAPGRLLDDDQVARGAHAERGGEDAPGAARPAGGGRATARVGDALRSRAVWVLGAIALAGMLCEGAAADWSAVLLRTAAGAPAAVAGLGYAAFAAAMVAVRLAGDRLLARRRPGVVLAGLLWLATAAMALALVVGGPALTLCGFACLGAGVGLVVPTAFSAAGWLPGIPTATAVAVVSAIGWIGFVGGPPLIGRLAGLSSLPFALGLVPCLTAAIAVVVARRPAFAGRR